MIRVLVELIRQHIRQSDLIVRFGGEEFLLLLPNTGLAGAAHVAETIRHEVATNRAADPVQFTLSIGITIVSRQDLDIEETIARADGALYQAKREGKDRVCSATVPDPLGSRGRLPPDRGEDGRWESNS
ncbi:GGDEF domain-containing protein [Halochromatium sp.]